MVNITTVHMRLTRRDCSFYTIDKFIKLSLCMSFSLPCPIHPCPYPPGLMTTWPKPSMFPSSLHPAAINSAVRGKAPDPSPISSRALQLRRLGNSDVSRPVCPFHVRTMNCPGYRCHLLASQHPAHGIDASKKNGVASVVKTI